jgi:tetratricopeptide (TPR) repeat protein
MGMLLLDLGRPAEAEEWFRRSLAANVTALGATHGNTLFSRELLGQSLLEQERFAEAGLEFAKCWEGYRSTFPPDDRRWATSQANLAALHLAEGRYEEALELARASVANREKWQPPGSWRLAQSRLYVAEALLALGRKTEAAPLLELARAPLETTRGPNHPLTRRLHAALARQ